MSKPPKCLVSSNTQASATLSDVLKRLESELNEFQSALQTPKARAATLATVDQDINAAKRLMFSMFTRRNTLVPIYILHSEIFSRIFHFVALFNRSSSRDWVHVTHVCRHWRQIALDDSTLWTYFSSYPRNKDWIAERLSRARNAPLVIKVDRWLGKDTLSLFIPHISNTRKLHLHNLSSFRPEFVQEVRVQKAPVLESLELGVSNNFPMNSEHGHLFFKGPLPKLRILRVSQIVFPWSLFPRGQLTQLQVILSREVSTVTSKDSQNDDLNQLIDLLINCPALEVLALENCLPAMLCGSSGRQAIHLPRLSRLSLGRSSSRVTNWLKMLKLSSSTTLCLTCTPENTTTHNDYHILPILSEHFNDLDPVEFRRLEVCLDDGDSVMTMVASTYLPIPPVNHTDVIQAHSDTDLCLSFHRVAELNNRVDILRRVCDVLSLSNLEFLFMHFPTSNEFINCGELFRRCTEVTKVKVSGRGTIGLLQALTPPNLANTTAREKLGKRERGDNGRGAQAQASKDDDNDGPIPVHVPIFPKLTFLRLEMLDFTDTRPGSSDLYDLILSAVQRRKMNKTPLTTLCIYSCVINEEQANALEKLVPDFRWDHDKGDHEDYNEYDDNEESESSSWGDDIRHLDVEWARDGWEHEW